MTQVGRCDVLEAVQGAEWKLKCNRTATYWSEKKGWMCDYHYRHGGPGSRTDMQPDTAGNSAAPVTFQNRAARRAAKTERRGNSKRNRYK